VNAAYTITLTRTRKGQQQPAAPTRSVTFTRSFKEARLLAKTLRAAGFSSVADALGEGKRGPAFLSGMRR
jgi:hypothetical protein